MEVTYWTKIKRLLPSILFPVVSVSAIYADWRHTYLWKKSLEAEKQGAAAD